MMKAISAGAFNWAAYAAVNRVWYHMLGPFTLPQVKQGEQIFRKFHSHDCTEAKELLTKHVTKRIDLKFNRILYYFMYMASLLTRDHVNYRMDVRS